MVGCCLWILLGNLFGQQIKNENGVPVVLNLKNPPVSAKGPIKLVLEEELTIGDPTKGKDYALGSIRTVRADQKGNIYILDGKDRLVKVFDKSGKYLRTIGSPGTGFKGMQNPWGMEVIPQQGIWIFHSEFLSLFSFQGQHLKDIKAPKIIDNPHFDSQGNIIAGNFYHTMTSDGKTKESNFISELKKYTSDFIPFSILSRFELPLPSRDKVSDPILRRICFTVLDNDDVVWGSNTQYRLTVTDKDGRIIRIFQKEYDPVKISENEKNRIIALSAKNSPGWKLEFSEFYPAFYTVTTDDGGRILVGTFDEYEKNQRSYDVFDAAGMFLTKIVLKHTIQYWKAGHLFATEEDSEGKPIRVIRYKASWK